MSMEKIDHMKDFCNMQQFENMLKNWSISTGLAVIAIGNDGKYISKPYNFTDFCHGYIRKTTEGLKRCRHCDETGTGIYSCHAGLIDFAIPLILENGLKLGQILAGQVLPTVPNVETYRQVALELGIDESELLSALMAVNIRSEAEISASAKLLESIATMFIQTSYNEWINEQDRAFLTSELSLDPMTGLLNKPMAFYKIDKLLSAYPNASHALLFLDLDNFKQVNEIYGHLVGDQLIIKTAQIIMQVFRKTDILSRFGGDEYAIFLPNISNENIVDSRITELLERLKTDVEKFFMDVDLTASIGVAFSEPEMEVNTLFQYADDALRAAKRTGKNHYLIYTESVRSLLS